MIKSFGAAIYVNIAEQPARLLLADGALLDQCGNVRPGYSRGFAMQAPMCVLGCLFGLVAWWQTKDWRWSIGALLLIANAPYTLRFILPTNTVLKNTAAADAGTGTRQPGAIISETRGRLHADPR